MAREIFDRVNESYMVFNKGSQHGINHNTSLLIKDLISQVLLQTDKLAREECAKIAEGIGIRIAELTTDPIMFPIDGGKMILSPPSKQVATAFQIAQAIRQGGKT